MKVKIVAHTPVGMFMSAVGEETTVEGVSDFLNMIKENMTYFINTENGTVLLKKEVIDNSVFEIITVEE